MNDERTPLERDQEAAIRRWMGAAPEHAPDRAVSATIDALRETRQPRRVVLSMSLPMAAAVAVLMVVVVGGLAMRGLGPLPAASPTPTPVTSAACSIKQVVGGHHPFFVGTGFTPDLDVVVEIDRANGTHVTFDRRSIFSLHTDETGRFGVELVALTDDVGTGRVTAIAGCAAVVDYVVTPEQVGARCFDPGVAQSLMDGAAYRAAVAADQPSRWWHFDDPGPIAVDAVDNANGSWIGELTDIRSDSGGGALFLSGDGASYVDIPSLTLPGEFTVEAWVLLCDLVDNADTLVGNGDQAPNINFFDARLRLFVGDEGDDIVVSNTFPRIGAWEHWAVTRDSEGVTRLFHNGLLDSTGGVWNGVMRIIVIGGSDAGTLRGAIDELAIYDRALTEVELTGHVLAE